MNQSFTPSVEGYKPMDKDALIYCKPVTCPDEEQIEMLFKKLGLDKEEKR